MTAKVERHPDEVRCRETQVLRLHALQAANKERGSHKQQRAERDLNADECVLKRESAGGTMSSAGAELRREIRTANLAQWRECGNDAGKRRGDESHNEHTAIDERVGRCEIWQQRDADDIRE